MNSDLTPLYKLACRVFRVDRHAMIEELAAQFNLARESARQHKKMGLSAL
jgi:hypothetical protein